MTDHPSHPGQTPHVRLEARTPEDVLAAVPVVLGFEPSHSVVMLTFGGAENLHARVDLPPPGRPDEAVQQLLEPAVLHAVERVLFIVYAADARATRTLTERLRVGFGRAGIDVVEILRVHDGRWFAPGRPARSTFLRTSIEPALPKIVRRVSPHVGMPSGVNQLTCT